MLMNVSLGTISGIMYPPRNRMAVSADISTMLQYSAKKKKTKHSLAYRDGLSLHTIEQCVIHIVSEIVDQLITHLRDSITPYELSRAT